MEKFSLYVKIICLVSILSGVLSALIPKGRLKSAYLSLAGIILLSSMVMPFKLLSDKRTEVFSFDTDKAGQSISREAETVRTSIHESMLKEEIEKKLVSDGIKASVTVRVKNENQKLYIAELHVKGELSDEEKNVINAYFSEASEKPHIILEEDENGRSSKNLQRND